MVFLMYIEAAVRVAGLLSDQCFHAVIGTVLFPSLPDLELFQFLHAVHGKEIQRRRDLTRRLRLIDPDIRQRSSHPFQIFFRNFVELYRFSFHLPFEEIIEALKMTVVLYDVFAGIRELFHTLRHQECGKTVLRHRLIDIPRQQFVLKKSGIRDKKDIIRFRYPFLPSFFPALHTSPQDIRECKKNIPSLHFIRRHIPCLSVL